MSARPSIPVITSPKPNAATPATNARVAGVRGFRTGGNRKQNGSGKPGFFPSPTGGK